MREWKECKLGEVAEITSSKRIYYSEYVDNGVPFFRSKEIIERFNKQNTSTELFIKRERYEEIKLKFGAPQEGDILLTSVGTLGIPYLVRKEDEFYFKDGNLTWFRNIDFEAIDRRFLYFWITSVVGQQQLNEASIGSTQPALTIVGLKNIDILLPPLPEQHAIAGVLSSLDDKIDILHRQNKTLEGMAEALWRKMFVEEADPGWKKVKVSDIIEVRDGTHDSPKQTEYGYHLITSRHLKKEGIDYLNAYKISEEDYLQINKRSKVEKNDLLFSMIGTLGLIHYVDEEPNFAIKNIGLFKSSQKPEFTKFLYLLLKSPFGEDFIFENADGSTQEYISLGNLRGLTFQYPGDKEINHFNNLISSYFEKIFSNSIQIRTLSRLRDTLLPKLISGEVRVNNE